MGHDVSRAVGDVTRNRKVIYFDGLLISGGRGNDASAAGSRPQAVERGPQGRPRWGNGPMRGCHLAVNGLHPYPGWSQGCKGFLPCLFSRDFWISDVVHFAECGRIPG